MSSSSSSLPSDSSASWASLVGVAGAALVDVAKDRVWGVDALAAGGYVATMWLEEQAWRKAFLIAGNAPVVFVGLWFSVSAARRSAVATWLTLQTAHKVVGVVATTAVSATSSAAQKVVGAVKTTTSSFLASSSTTTTTTTTTSPESINLNTANSTLTAIDLPLTVPVVPVISSSSPSLLSNSRTALPTLAALIRAAPRPGLGIHLIGYITALAMGGASLWLWRVRPSRGGGGGGGGGAFSIFAISDLLSSLSLPIAAAVAVAASESAADAEDGIGFWGNMSNNCDASDIDQEEAVLTKRAIGAALLASSSAAIWASSTSASLSHLETKLADAVAAAAKVVTAAASLLSPRWLSAVTTGATSSWSAGPLGAALTGAILFTLSFSISKVSILTKYTDTDLKSTAAPQKGERMYSYIFRVLDA